MKISPSLRLLSFTALLTLIGCSNTMEKLSRVGETPKLAEMEIPVNEEFEEDVEMSLKQQAQAQHARRTNSLWQPGHASFLRDNRTWRVGDIVKIIVEIKDSAKLDNTSGHTRKG